MGDQNLGEARNLEVGLAKGGPDIGKITEEGVFHHPDRGPRFPHVSTAAGGGIRVLLSENLRRLWVEAGYFRYQKRRFGEFFGKMGDEGVAVRLRLKVAGGGGNFRRAPPSFSQTHGGSPT
jgi:hypothetical protein